ncbi:MAG: hypothetical protein AB3N20_13025 [Rhizobiaceae bacterium]
MRFIGDVHGDFARYEQLIGETGQSVQIGDLGLGYGTVGADGVVMRPDPPFDVMKRAGSHRFIRGNQDDPAMCRQSELWIADGTVDGDVFYCGGAETARRQNRIEGVNWWPDEELSEAEFAAVHEKYLDAKPRLMVTHDCPVSIGAEILAAHDIGKPVAVTRTRKSFEAMLALHKPQIWIFGHWHLPFDRQIGSTRFICLDILQTIDL